MARQIFVNLPVRDLDRSKAFFSRLGLLAEPFFKTFTSKPVADAKKSTEVLVCLSCGSKDEVDGLVAKASAHGGKTVREPQDHGFMYQHAFEDPDGHIWELVHMRSQP